MTIFNGWVQPINQRSLNEAHEDLRSVCRENIRLRAQLAEALGTLEAIAGADCLPGEARRLAEKMVSKLEGESS